MSIFDTITRMENDTNKVNFDHGRNKLGTDQLDKASFLQLLMAQLKYQDPTEPVDNQQFIQQQAMFTQIDSLNKLNDTLTASTQITQASAMVGKYVQVSYMQEGYTEPTVKTGQVTGVVIQNGAIGLRLAGHDTTYALNAVTGIYQNNPTPPTTGS